MQIDITMSYDQRDQRQENQYKFILKIPQGGT